MKHNDRIITDGFPEGWYIQDRMDDDVALLCRNRTGLAISVGLGGPVCVCARPKAITTDDWLISANIIAHGFEAETARRIAAKADRAND